jgi:uncharacterized protein YecT (DUF1311 family)
MCFHPIVRWTRASALASLLLLTPCVILAIDNPDGTRWLAPFEQQCQAFEIRLQTHATDNAAMLATYADYERYLDGEINRAYQHLLPRLKGKARQQFSAAQRQWLSFRKTEQAFILQHWTPDRFGQSARLTQAASRVLVLKHRANELVVYVDGQ